MKAKFTLVGALLLALAATIAIPSTASARSRFRVHVYFGTQPYYYYQTAPGYYYYQPDYYYTPAPSYYYYQTVPRYYYYRTSPRYYYGSWSWRRHDRGLHRGWYKHGWDRDGDRD